MRRSIQFALLVTSIILLCGCPGEQSSPEGTAKAFFSAMAQHDLAKATTYVHPKQRETFRKTLEKKFPEIPLNLKIEMRIAHSGKHTAIFKVGRDTHELNLKQSDGKWWVVQ